MSTSPVTSRYAHLYVGDAADGRLVVFRDLAPRGVPLPESPITPWPDGSAFAVVFPPGTNRRFESNRGRPMVTFYDMEGWPIGFPTAGRSRFTPAARRTMQNFPFTWARWSQRELDLYCSDGGEYLVRLYAQSRVGTCAAAMISV